MKTLGKINPENVSASEAKNFEVRDAVRAVLLDESGMMALLHVGKHNYHKLPGGGIEEGEEMLDALARECFEETGCQIKAGEEIGKIVEHRKKFSLKQTSYCFLASVVGSKGKPSFTKKEIADEFKILWVDIHEASKLSESDSTSDYEGGFIKDRDMIFIKEAIKRIKKFVCKECGYEYEDKIWANKCEAWCKEHRSCNLEIIQHGTPPGLGSIKPPMQIASKRNPYTIALAGGKIGAFIGLLAGILYAFGGLIIDAGVTLGWITNSETPGLSIGTVLAFGALIGMPIIFAIPGLLIGAIAAPLYNLITRR